MESGPDGLDGLMMGNVSEETKESNDQFAARVAAAQARMAQVRKDEKVSRDFDIALSKILPSISRDLLNFIIFLINHEVPSLTILAIISLENTSAEVVCRKEFEKYIAERADFSGINLDKVTEDRVSYWWTFMFAADHSSKILRLRDLKANDQFIGGFKKGLGTLIKDLLARSEVVGFDLDKLKQVLAKYEKMIFK